MNLGPAPDSPRVLTLGETMGLAVTATGETLRSATNAALHTAGAESTVAIGLSRLGIEVSWAGVVGADEIGARVLRDLRAEGVDTDAARVAVGPPTGFMLRERRTSELVRVTYFRAGSAGSTLAPEDVDHAFDTVQPSLVHLTGITPALSESAAAAVVRAIELAEAGGVAVSFDVNHRPSLPGSATAGRLLRDLLPRVDVLFAGEDELAVLGVGGDPLRAADALVRLGIGEVVVKRGSSGAIAQVGTSVHQAAALKAPVVDVVGAGDSFVAGYLAARVEGLDITGRLHWGVTTAAFAIGSRGDWEGLPTRAELTAHVGGTVTER